MMLGRIFGGGLGWALAGPIGGLIGWWLGSRFDEQRTRVVIDLNHVAEYKLTTLKDPQRLVIDIKGQPLKVGLSALPRGKKTASAADDSIALILNNAPERQSVLHVPQKTHDEGIHLIVVDAGHGGKDPGAIGPDNVYETKRKAQ